MTEWLLIIIALFAAFLIFKLIKSAISLFLTVTTVIGIILLVVGFFAVQDAMEFKENFAEEKNIFVLADNQTYRSAVVLELKGENSSIETFRDVDNIDNYLEEGLPEEYYKIFIIKKEALQKSSLESVDIGIGELTKNETIRALYSDDPHLAVAAAVAGEKDTPEPVIKEQLEEFFSTEDELRNQLFISSIIPIFGGEPLALIEGVKDENIIIAPDSLMFTTIKYIPDTVFETVDGVATNDTEEKDGNNG